MYRTLVIGLVAVSTIAALKTYLILQLVRPEIAGDWAMVSGLYIMFFCLTGLVAYFSIVLLRTTLERQRKQKLAPGASEPAAKETIVLRNASDWGLSQAEADVAIFVVKGFSNAEIADMRGCAVATVKSQLGRIYHKSGLGSRYQLISFVTDEVCAMAVDHDADVAQVETRKVLPLVGRSASHA